MKKTTILSIFLVSLMAFSACGAEVETVETGEAVDVVEEPETSEEVMDSKIHEVDTEQSVVKWEGSKVVGSSHGGTVEVMSGEMISNDGEYVGGSFVIDMNTIESEEGLDGLVDHLKNEDFFEVATYPEAKFEITEIKKDGEQYMVSGNLEIKGVTKNISFPATMEEGEEMDKFMAEFAIDRTEWGVEYSSGKVFSDLGDKAINDEMEFVVELVVKK